MLANRTKDRQWKVPEEALAPAWRPLFESRRDPRELLKKYQDAYYLKPYQVLVLESRLRPARLIGRMQLFLGLNRLIGMTFNLETMVSPLAAAGDMPHDHFCLLNNLRYCRETLSSAIYFYDI